jgi:hypothetical protein
MSETKTETKLSPAKAKSLFQKTVKRLHEAGFNVLAVLQLESSEGDDTTTRLLLQGDPKEFERAKKVMDLLGPLQSGAMRTLVREHPHGAIMAIEEPMARAG